MSSDQPPTPPAPPPMASRPPTRRKLNPLLAVVALIVVLGVAATALVAMHGRAHHGNLEVHGSLDLRDLSSAIASLAQSTCSGSGGYSDITAGAEVVISDDAGKTLAISHLEGGNPGGPNDPAGHCRFTFTTDVPSGKGFYGITVTHRGLVRFTEQDIKAGPALTIGG